MNPKNYTVKGQNAIAAHAGLRIATNFKKPAFAILVLSVLFFVTGLEYSHGQASITSATAVIENFNAFTSPTAGNAVSGGNSPTNWTLTATGNTWRGTNQAGGASGGWYSNSNISFLGSGSASNGQCTWVLQNNTATTITGFTLSFTGRMWKAGSASPTVSVSYQNSASSSNPAAGALTSSLGSLSFNDATSGISSGTTLTQTVTGLSIATSQYIFIRFIHPGGSNSDNLGWDDISFTATLATPLLTPPTLTAASATVDADFNITYTDDAAWRLAVTAVKYGTPTLNSITDYSFAAGILTLKPTGPNGALHLAGTQTVTVIATGYTDATISQPIGAGADNKLAMNVQPTAPATNGGALATQPSVFIQDQYNNPTSSTAVITANTGSGSWTPTGSTTATGVSGTATFSGLTATSAAAVVGATISFTSPGLTSVSSGTFNIPAPAGLPAPTLIAASATVDADFDITFSDDASWRSAVTVVTYGFAVLNLGTDYSFSAGILTLKPTGGNPALQAAGTEIVTVSATGYDDATVSQTIGAGADFQLAMDVQPTAPALNGGALAVQPSVFIQDQYGNATSSTAIVTANTGSGTWTPGGSTTATGISGTATFSGLTATSASSVTGATINFTSPGLVAVSSGTFNIPAPSADHIAFVSTPTDGVTNSYLNSFTIEARRPDNSVDNTFTGSIVISIATGSGSLIGTLTKSAFAGVATFNDIKLNAADTYTLNANSGSFSQITSSSIVVIDPIAKWTFDASTIASPGATAVFNVGSPVAEEGVQTAGSVFSSLHASSATIWAANAGNGSVRCITSDHWALDDYYQFQVNTTNFHSIGVSFEQTGSNTGPNSFTFSYSTDGITFTPVSSFAITNDGWSASSPKSASKHSFDLSAVPALNGLSAVYFRLVCNSTTAISGAFGSGGTNRVDNFTITGTPCTGPSAFAVTGGGSYCTGGTGVAVGLAGSASGVNYQLVLDGITNVGSPEAGTGLAINFGDQTTVGAYTVVATNTTTSCTATMTGSASVSTMVCAPACAVTDDFTAAVTTGPIAAANTWYTDRFAPSGFSSPVTFGGDARLQQSINAADCETCRGGFNGAFYNTQGRKFDLPSSTISSQIELYVPSAWATTNKRMAGFWATAFDVSSAVSAYPILEFTSDLSNPRFRAYETGTGTWIDMGLPAGFSYDTWVTLRIDLLPSGEFRYSVNDLRAETSTSAPDASVRLGNVILQGHNTLAGVTYDIYWDNFSYSPIYANVVASGLLSCATGTVTVTVTAVGGQSPYSGEGTFSVGAGTHTYTVTDDDGCTNSASITISPAPAHSGTKWYVNDNSLTGDVFTSALGNAGNSGTAACPFATIAQAIAACVAGDTIYADAGTYNENVAINKALTLIGSGPATTILTPTVACTGDGISISVANVNVSNLTVTGFNYGIRTSASTISLYNVESNSNCLYGLNTSTGTNGLTMVKCKFNTNTVGGWRAGTGDLVSNVLMDSSEVKGNGIGSNGFGMFIAASTPAANTFDYITIQNSDFSNNLEKGMYFEKLRHALIDNVTINNSGTDVNYGFNTGIDINLKYDSYSDITIQNSSITNCGVMGTASDVKSPCAIAIKGRDDAPSYSSDPASLSGFSLLNCYISGPVNGLRFGEFNKVNATPTGITVTNNDFGSAYSNKAVLNTTSNTGVIISCNWYGTTTSSTIAGLHSNIASYTPYLTGGADGSASPGFQPSASCTGLPCSVANDFTSSVTIGPIAAVNTWYTDRFAPAGFTSPDVFGGDARLKQSINAADCETCRGGFNGAFYNTQGRKFDLPAGTKSTQIDLYIPSAWATSGKRMAGLWGTAFDVSNAVSGYPILEFTSDGANPRFRGYETGTGTWIDMGLPSGFSYDTWVTLKIEVLPSGEFRYSVNDLQAETSTSAPDASVRLANTILQGHNTLAGVTYDIYWDNYSYSQIFANVVVTGTLGCYVSSVSINVSAVGGQSPYTGEGTFTVGAGTYTYTVTDANSCSASATTTVVAAFATPVHNTNTGLNYCTIQDAINAVQTLNGHTITVDAGTYNEDVTVNKQLTILGAGIGSSIVSGPIGGGGSTFAVTSSNVVIDGFTITRDGNNTTDWNNSGLNSAGIAIQSQGIFAEVRFCEITGMRTAIDINNSNGNNIHNNNMHFNRTGMIFRNQTDNTIVVNNFIKDNWTVGVLFLDASSGTNSPVQTAANCTFNNNDISGNWYGQIVDRQLGGSLPAPGTNTKNFTCNWYGVIPPVVSTANSSEPGYAAQIPVAYGGSAVAPGGQPDILGGASANFVYTPYLLAGTDLGGITNDGFQPASACSAPCALIVSASSTDATCPSFNDGTASVSITSGGVSPYTYLWSNGATTASLSGLSAGTYTVTVTDVNGCTATASTTISASLAGPVHNINTGLNYCTIQAAINAVSTVNGHTITIDPGTYNEQVLVNKQLTIKAATTQPTVDFTGTVSGKPTLFDISADNVTIDNIHFNVDLSKLRSAIIASAAGIDNIVVKNNIIDAYGTPAGSYGDRNAVSINYTGSTNYRVATGGVNSITFDNNTVNGSLPTSFFRAGIATDESGGTYTNNTLQTINHDVLVRFGSNGNITISGNNFNGGGVELDDMNAGAGTLTVSTNIFDATFANSSAPGTAVMRLQNNYNSKTTVVSGNTFSNHQWAVSMANYNSVTIDNNTFTPLAGSTVYHHVVINNKSISTNSNSIVQVTIGATVTNNTFNGSGTLGGTAVSFHNHDNDAASYGTFVIGGSGSENDFNANIGKAIYLDHQSGTSSGSTFPAYTSLIGAGAGALTTMGLWTPNIDATDNNFDVGSGLELPSAMSLTNLFTLEDRIQHSIDASGLGFVRVKANNDYVTVNSFASPLTTTAKIQRGVDAASNGHTVNVDAGSFNDNVIVNKQVNIAGQGQGVTMVYPATSNPNCGGAGGGSLCAGGSNVFLVQANNVTIHGLTVDGDNTALTSGTVAGGADLDARNGVITDHNTGVYSNLEVYNVTIQNIYLRGMYASTGGSFNFHDNTVNNVQANAASIGMFNFGGAGAFTNNTVTDCNDAIASNWSTGTTYTGNLVSSSASGIHSDNNGGSGGVADVISGNTVQNSDVNGYGIWVFAPYRAVQVLNNTVSNVDVGLTSAGQNAAVTPLFSGNVIDGQNKVNSTGVYITTSLFGFGSSNVTVDFNNNYVINNAADGFFLESEAGQTLTLNAHNNSITGNAPYGVEKGTGLSGAGTFTVDMGCNWWGSANSTAVATAVGAAIDYTPWLVGGTDGDLITSGFQPSASCTGAPCSESNDFSTAVAIGATQAPGVWYTDRFAPAGFTSPEVFGGDDRLKQSINAADCETCRGGFNGAFYNTQGRKFDLPANSLSSQIELFIPSSWATTGKRMAGFWATAFDAGNAVSGYPILEFTSDGANPRFRGYETGTGTWIDMGLPSGFAYDSWVSLRIDVLPSGEFRYSVNELRAETSTSAPDASVRLANVILQGHNTLAGVTYDIYWDNFSNSPLYANLTVTGSLNCNVSSVSVNVAAVGGQSPYSGEGTFSVGAGTHTYTVTDTYGCAASSSVTITAPATLVASVVLDAPIACNGGSSTVTVSATGGSTPYTGTGSISVTAGTHTYTVTDVNGCTATTTITVSEPTAMSASATSTDATCPSYNNGTATVTASGGTSPYTYLWSNSQTGSTATALVTGTYTVTVTDANGCTTSTSATVAGSLAGPVHNINTGLNYCTIQAAISAVSTVNGHTITVDAGTYNEDVTVNKQLTILGAGIGSSIVSGPIGGGGSTFAVTSSNVVIDGFTITRAGNNTTDWNNAGLNSAGIAIQSQGIFAEVRFCEITGMRTAIDINNSNGNNIHNNNIHFNRTGMIFRNQTDNTIVVNNFIKDNWTVGVLFLDASSGTNSPVQTAANCTFNNNDISGNWYGQIVDRQLGGSLPAPGTNLKNFTCNWYGVIPPVVSTANSSEPGYAAQIPVAYGGSAVAPGGQPDILGGASANFVYIPYLTTGTDVGGITNDGFQPVAGCSAPCALVASSSATAIACTGGTSTVTVSASGGTGSYTGTGTFTVTAGTYTYTVTDANGCTATTSVTVTAPVHSGTKWYVNDNSQSGDVYTSAIGGVSNIGTAACPFLTITQAISAASSGDSIYVDAGTYSETLVIGKSVKLFGANAGIPCGSRGSESQLQAATAGSTPITVSLNGVSINGFEIIGSLSNYAIAAGSGKNDLSVTFNNIHDLGTARSTGNVHAFMYTVSTGVSTSNVTVSDNCFNNINNAGNTASGAAIGILQSTSTGTLSNLVIERNTITNVNSKTAVSGGKGAYGIILNTGGGAGNVLGSVISPVIRYNTISNLNGLWSHAIGLEGRTPGALVSNNTISNISATSVPVDACGVRVEANDGSSSVTVTENSFSSVQYGIINVTAGTVSATCNWYNVTSFSGVSAMQYGPVTFSPWLVNGTDDLPLTAGFQPVAGSCTGVEVTLSETHVSVLCNGLSTGSIDLSVLTGASPFTYAWSNSSTTEDISGLSAGTYSVTVTDANGSTATLSVVISEPSAMSASATATDATCPSYNNGTATVTASGGISPYTYLWSNGATTASLSGLSAGTYTVTVTDANGCTTTTSATVAGSLAGPVHNINTGLNYCTIQAAINAVSTVNGHTITVDAGTYNEDVTVNKQLTILGAGIGSSIVSGPIGGGGSTFAVTSSNVVIDGFTITRDGNNTTDWNNAGLNSAGIAIQSQGIFAEVRFCEITGMRTAIDINNSNGNNIHNNNMHFNRTGMIFRNQTDNTIVVNNFIKDNWTVGVLFLDASSGTNSPVQTAANCTFNNNDISGNWYGQIVDRQLGGSLPAPGTNLKNFTCNWYGVIPPVVSTANSSEPGYAAQIPVAYGGSAVAPGGQPDILGGASANFVYTPYLITGTDVGGITNDGFQPVAGCSAPCALVASSSSTAIACNGGTATVTVSASGGTGSYSGTGTFTVTAGTYTYTVTDVNGCTATTTITVSEPTAMSASATSTDATCPSYNNGTATVTASGGTSPYTYLWSNSQTGSTATALATGTYTVTATDANGCTTSTSVTVAGSLAGPVHNINTGLNYCTIQAAISAVSTVNGHTITVDAGTYNEDVTVNKQLTILGAGIGSSIVSGPIGGGGSTFAVTSSNVVIDGFTITRDGNNTTDWNNAGLNSAGIAIQSQGIFAEVRFCEITGMRTAIDINNSNGNNIHNNNIHFNRTGMIFRNQTDNTIVVNNFIKDNWTVGVLFLDASSGTNSPVQTAANCTFNNNDISGNWYGQIVDRQLGGSLPAPGTNLKNFTCNWYGVIPPVVSTANSSEPGYAAQIPVAYGGSAVAPGGQPDILGGASANFVYTPYLTTGTDVGGITNDGFQPVSGCSAPCALVASSSATAIACNGGTATVTVSASGGTGSYTGTGTFTVTAGTYTYTVTDVNGCTATTTITITEPAVLVASSSSTAIACNGGTATVTVSASGGTAPYTGTGPVTVTAGTYTYTVTDANGCTNSTTITVTEPTALVASSSATAIACNGGTSTVTVSATGGTAPYTGTGPVTVTAGTYTYTVTDANGCTNSTTITVTEPTALVASSSATAIACNGGTSTVTVSASGGTAPYTGTGPVTVTAGTYTYTVTDANGCTNSTTITVTEPTALVASSSATAIACNGGTSTVTVSATGGTAPYTGTGPVTVTAGTYTYTVTDANGCTNSTTITVTEPTALVASSSATAIACNGGTSTVTVSASGGTAPYTGTGPVTVTAGTYTYTVTDANGCTNSTTITITEPTALVASSSATAIACNGGTSTVTVSASGGTAPYTGTGPVTVTAGTYTYTVTDANGCTNSTTITVTEPTALVASSSATAIACNGGTSTVTVSASGGTAPYTGTGPVTVTAGTYTYTVTDANGCTNSTTITVTEPTALVASSSATAIACNGGTSTVTVSATGGTGIITGTGTFTVTAGTYTYTVTDANGCTNSTTITVTQPSPVVATYSATPILCYGQSTTVTISATGGTGPYTGTGPMTQYVGTIVYTVTDNNGCQGTVSVTLTEPAKVEGTATSTPTTCAGNDGTATVAPTGGTGSYTYSWSNGPTTQSISSLVPGTYTVIITDGNGCTGSASTTVTSGGSLPATPGAISGPGGACRNQTGVVYSIVAVPGATSYDWVLPAGASGSSTSNSITVSFGPTYAGGFICVASVNVCGTSTQSCMNIPVLTIIPSQPTPISGPSIICGGNIATYTATSTNALSYLWSVTGTGVYIISGQGTNSIQVNIPIGFGQGSVQVRGVNCMGNSQVRGMTITGTPIHSNAVIGPNYICANNTATYTMPLVTGASTYTWTTTGDITLITSSQNSLNTVASFNFGPAFTSGTITITVSNSCGSFPRTFVVRSAPDQPGGISGPGTGLCGLSGIQYSISAVATATSYTWTSTNGIAIQSVSPDGLTVTVNFTGLFTNNGNICVVANNGCGSSVQRCFTVSARPSTPVVSGSASVCKSQTAVVYSIPVVPTATSYTWSVTGGGVITPSGLTASVNYTSATSTSAIVRVNAINTCGASQPGVKNVSVNLLCRTASDENSSEFSGDLTAYPNPTSGKATVEFTTVNDSKMLMTIMDLPGNILISEVFSAIEGNNTVDIDLSDLAKGIYLLNLKSGENVSKTIRLVVE